MCDCIFCKIVKKDIPSIILYEDKDCMVILDRFPSSVGHSLVISKRHYKNALDIDEDLYSKIMRIANRYAKIIYNKTSCNGINILQNSNEVAGQTVYHIHVHIIPRYECDDVNIKWNVKECSIEELENFAKEVGDLC